MHWLVRTVEISAALLLAATSIRGGSITGTVSPPKADSVVYVNVIAGKKFPAPAKHFTMNQKSLQFQPHVLVVQAGTTVDFLNGDPRRHNIFWPSVNGDEKQSHNLGTWPQGQIRSFRFDVTGVVPLGCNVHPQMEGYIVVSPTPYFAVTDATGTFRIANVPDGTYQLSAWQEGMKVQTKPATVAGSAKASFTLTK